MTEILKLDERKLLADALQRAAAETRCSVAERLDELHIPTMERIVRAQIDALNVRAQKQEQLAQRVREAETVSIVNMKRRSKR